jgi:hypothetical protein
VRFSACARHDPTQKPEFIIEPKKQKQKKGEIAEQIEMKCAVRLTRELMINYCALEKRTAQFSDGILSTQTSPAIAARAFEFLVQVLEQFHFHRRAHKNYYN